MALPYQIIIKDRNYSEWEIYRFDEDVVDIRFEMGVECHTDVVEVILIFFLKDELLLFIMNNR